MDVGDEDDFFVDKRFWKVGVGEDEGFGFETVGFDKGVGEEDKDEGGERKEDFFDLAFGFREKDAIRHGIF